jgi:hypothetical protein
LTTVLLYGRVVFAAVSRPIAFGGMAGKAFVMSLDQLPSDPHGISLSAVFFIDLYWHLSTP